MRGESLTEESEESEENKENEDGKPKRSMIDRLSKFAARSNEDQAARLSRSLFAHLAWLLRDLAPQLPECARHNDPFVILVSAR